MQTTGSTKNSLVIMIADIVKVGRVPTVCTLPCTLCLQNALVGGQTACNRHAVVFAQPRVAAGDVIRTFNESNKSPYIKRQQTIFHPGEVPLCAAGVSWK
jgi:hypothetical protein